MRIQWTNGSDPRRSTPLIGSLEKIGMEYMISTPKRDAARRRAILDLRNEMDRRAEYVPLSIRAREWLKAAAIIAVLMACILAASYGDTISGINPAPHQAAAH